MKITIEFNDTKEDFKAECYEAIRIIDLAKESLLAELNRAERVCPPDLISSWEKEIDGDTVSVVCVFEIKL
jgi:hypothetical protein